MSPVVAIYQCRPAPTPLRSHCDCGDDDVAEHRRRLQDWGWDDDSEPSWRSPLARLPARAPTCSLEVPIEDSGVHATVPRAS